MIDYDLKITRDDEKVFTASGNWAHQYDWLIYEDEGIDTAEIENTTIEKAVGNGSFFKSVRAPLRSLSFSFFAKNCNNNLELRKNALSFFNAFHSYTILIKYGNNERQIQANLDTVKAKTMFNSENQRIEVSFICCDPFFKSISNYGKNLAGINGMWGFPFMSAIEGETTRTGFVFSAFAFESEFHLNNDGDVPSYPKIIITASGTVTNLYVGINGKTVKYGDEYIHRSIVNGDILIFDIENKIVTLNNLDVTGKIGWTSDLSGTKINPGDNLISFGASAGDANMKVQLYYYQNFLGA